VLAAGYGLSRLVGSATARRSVVAVSCGLVYLFPVLDAYSSAASWFHSWPNNSSLQSVLGPLTKGHPNMVVSLQNGSYLCDYEYSKYGSAWLGCSLDLNVANIKASKADFIVLGYVTPLGRSSSLSPSMLLSLNKTSIAFINLLEQGQTQHETQLTEFLEKTSLYKLKAAGPYDTGEAAGIYTIWERVQR
jgi:hypothetical protein